MFRDLLPPDVVVDLVVVLVVDIDRDGNVNLVGRALTQDVMRLRKRISDVRYERGCTCCTVWS
jgi:hypothetical protein